MMLLDLPMEVLGDILFYTRPEGFEAFVLSCKTIHGIATFGVKTNLLREHNELSRSWNKILPLQNEGQLISPLHACLSIYQNPLIGPYVQTLELYDMNDCTGVTCAEVEGLLKSEGFKDFLLNMDIWSKCEDEVDAALLFDLIRPWSEADQKSAMDFACICLLFLLPNLKNLYFRDIFTTGYDMFAIIAASIYEEPTQPGFLNPFQNLTRVVIEIDADNLYNEAGEFWFINLCDVTALLILPSLELLRIGRLHANNTGSKIYDFDPPPGEVSNLRELDASFNWVHSVAMEKFLRPMPFLRRLYWFQNSDGLMPEKWHVGDFVKSVTKVAGHQLEAFSICRGIGTGARTRSLKKPVFKGWIEDFRGFKTLKYLEFSVELLRGHSKANLQRKTVERGHKLPKLIDILPGTIEEVRIIMDSVSSIDRDVLFRSLAKRKKAILPQLREVKLSHPKNLRVKSKFRRLRRELARSDIGLDLQLHVKPHFHFLGRDEKSRIILHEVEIPPLF